VISRVWEATTAERMHIDPYCQRQKCRPVNVLSSDVRVMQNCRYSQGFGRYGASNEKVVV